MTTETRFRLPVLQIPTLEQMKNSDLNTIMERNCIRMLIATLEACAQGDTPARALDIAVGNGWHHSDNILELTKFVMLIPRKHGGEEGVELDLSYPPIQEKLPQLVANAMGEMDARVRHSAHPCDCEACLTAREKGVGVSVEKETSVGLH